MHLSSEIIVRNPKMKAPCRMQQPLMSPNNEVSRHQTAWQLMRREAAGIQHGNAYFCYLIVHHGFWGVFPYLQV